MINMQLANKLNLSDRDIQVIGFLQDRRNRLGKLYLSKVISPEEYHKAWEENEYSLQELWKFPKDVRYHKFWEMSGCTCPKMDNDDAYPTGYYIRDGGCPLHGEYTWQK